MKTLGQIFTNFLASMSLMLTTALFVWADKFRDTWKFTAAIAALLFCVAILFSVGSEPSRR